MRVVSTLKNGTDSFKELFLIYLGTVLTGAALFSLFEKVNIFNSIWWAFVTALTIGYGDISPHTVGGKIVGVILMHLVVLLIIPLIIGRAVTQLIDSPNQFTDAEQEELKASARRLNEWLDKQENMKGVTNGRKTK